ncbi:Phosphoribosylamine--glycine ligase [Vibrio chagasii]|nr:Phosphoribosylamine--glycine ligase [Vibrio chagasii]CAH6907253.1 Phosphoribosylamine--glycine ligase [Vibrio chagasii]
MNILTLDPMFSPLHDLISMSFPKGKRLALLSSKGLSVYLNEYEVDYFNRHIKGKYHKEVDKVIELVRSDVNHFTASLSKLHNRRPSENELNYMASYYLFLKDYLIENDIQLVLLHNDLRWQHSLAVKLCKALSIRYLVTEQGLFRPYTTVVDRVGVNAYSRVKLDFEEYCLNKNRELLDNNEPKFKIKPNRDHNSIISYFYFLQYLFLSKIGRLINTESVIFHKRHTFYEYFKRFIQLKIRRKTNNNSKILTKKTIFIPLQLQEDTQLLVHSDFKNNQQVIDLIYNCFHNLGLSKDYDLIFKLHPNDTNTYRFDQGSKVVDSEINQSFLSNVVLVISVNSSALLNVIETNIPIITLGRSIYDLPGVCQYSSVRDLESNIKKSVLQRDFDISRRHDYLNYLKREYSINGSGYYYPDSEIKKILSMFL